MKNKMEKFKGKFLYDAKNHEIYLISKFQFLQERIRILYPIPSSLGFWMGTIRLDVKTFKNKLKNKVYILLD
jgi:hypothetical protein